MVLPRYGKLRRLVSRFMRQIERVPPSVPYCIAAGLALTWMQLRSSYNRKASAQAAVWSGLFLAYGIHNQRHRPRSAGHKSPIG